MDNFLEPLTPEQKARQNAMAEIKEEMGKLKTTLRNEVRVLKKKRGDELIPSKQAILNEQIAKKQKDFDDVGCLLYSTTTTAAKERQDYFKRLIKWDEIMRKHGVPGY